MAKCSGDQAGAYSFVMRETTVTNLPVNTTYNGTLAGSGTAQLFKVTTTESKPLFVKLDDSTNTDQTKST